MVHVGFGPYESGSAGDSGSFSAMDRQGNRWRSSNFCGSGSLLFHVDLVLLGLIVLRPQWVCSGALSRLTTVAELYTLMKCFDWYMPPAKVNVKEAPSFGSEWLHCP